MKKRYDIVYSLGSNCACAKYLRDLNLRLSSGPLDWVVGATLSERAKLIEQNFNDFISLDFLEKRESTIKENDLYFDTRSHFLFGHDFPVGISLQEMFPVVKEKYARRIDRFFENVRISKHVLFVYFSLIDFPLEDEMFEMERVLKEKFGSGKFDFWLILHDEKVLKNEEKITCKKMSKNMTLWTGYLKGDDDLLGNIERCKLIFKPVGLSLAREIKMILFRRTLHVVENLICAFVFSKDCRTTIRRKIRGFFGQRY